MKVLISAYACRPGEGSEPGSGWTWASAAAERHRVWLATRSDYAEEVEAGIRDRGLDGRLIPVFIDLPPVARWGWEHKKAYRLQYLDWQRRAVRVMGKLHAEVGFDVGHHVTYANDYLPCALARVGVPFVWGPVGGSQSMPRSQLWALELGSQISEASRELLSRVARRLSGDHTARRAGLVVAANDDVAARFARSGPVVVEPNAAFDPTELPRRQSPDPGADEKTAIFLGRLLAMKGIHLAIDALAHDEAAGWRLKIVGSGPQEQWLRNRAAHLGVAHRVDFVGLLPRQEALAHLAQAHCLLFPSLHDTAGWAVAEATAMGCPVVCLDVGGPPAIVRMSGGGGVIVDKEGDVALGLARGLQSLDHDPAPSERWGIDRIPDLLDEWYATAIADGLP